jgi:hypothetical protein
MPQEMNFPPSAEDTDNSADTQDCDREIMSASTTPPLLPKQVGDDTADNNNNNNNEPPATTSRSGDDEEQASLLGQPPSFQEAATTSSTSSRSPSPEKQVGDVTRVTFSPDITNGTPDRHASKTSNRDDDKSPKYSLIRDDASSSQKPEPKRQLQKHEERIIEHSPEERPNVRDPEGVMPSHGHSRKFSDNIMGKIVQADEVIPAPPRENEISSPDPPSPVPITEEPIVRRTSSDRSEEQEEKQQEIVDYSLPDDVSSPETTPRKSMVLSSILQEQEEPLSPLEEGDHLQLVNHSGGAGSPMMLHASTTPPPGSVAPPAPQYTVAAPHNGYMQQQQQQQQQYPPLLQPMDSNGGFHETQNPHQHHPPPHNMQFPAMPSMMQIPQLPPSVMTTKRKITLRLIEENPHQSTIRKTFLSSIRRRPKGNSFGSLDDSMEPTTTGQDRGRITVSWYEGTTSLELQEHVRRSVVRKIELRGTIKLKDMRILDESVHPPEGESLSFWNSYYMHVCCAMESPPIPYYMLTVCLFYFFTFRNCTESLYSRRK